MARIDDILASATTLGDAVRLLREERKLTLRETASRAGLSAPFLSDLEHNRRSTDKLPELARVLDVDPDMLRGLDGRVPPDLKQWMSANPRLGALLDEYRRSGKPVELLLRNLRSGLRTSRR